MLVRNGHVEIVKLLLKDTRVDSTANDNEALREAEINGHSKIVELLCADPRMKMSTKDLQIRARARDAMAKNSIPVVSFL